MKYLLHGRPSPQSPLRCLGGYPTYAKAVVAGQQSCGWGNFTIDTGDYVPTREEQLMKKSAGEIRAELLSSI